MPRARSGRSLRPLARAAAARAGVEEPLVRFKRAFDPPHIARDRRDNAHLRVALAALLNPDSNCIDVGAHRGEILAEMVRLAPAGQHVAYEPLPELAAALARRFPQVDVRAAALSDAAGERPFTHVVSNPGWSGLRERPLPRAREGLDSRGPRRATGRRAPGRVPARPCEDRRRGGRAGGPARRDGRHHRAPAHRLFEHGLGSADHYGTRPEDILALLSGQAGLRIFDLAGGGPYSAAQFAEAFAAGRKVNFMARR